jgi:hypothetical protein
MSSGGSPVQRTRGCVEARECCQLRFGHKYLKSYNDQVQGHGCTDVMTISYFMPYTVDGNAKNQHRKDPYLFDLRFLALLRGMEQLIRTIELKAQQHR